MTRKARRSLDKAPNAAITCAAVASLLLCASLLASPAFAGGPACSMTKAGDDSTIELLPADQRPPDWGNTSTKGPPVDTDGNPIVNQRPGLPGWAQRDVDDLRLAIANTAASLRDLPEALRGPTEDLLGNYIGQSLVREIDLEGVIDVHLDVTPGASRAAVDYLHRYENRVHAIAPIRGFRYRPTDYSRDTISLIEGYGSSLDEIRAIDPPGEAVSSTSSGCYDRTATTAGMEALSGATSIWNHSGVDDAEAVVPIFFNFVFYGCQKPSGNDAVLVSTNGYIVFHQSTGEDNGTEPSNVSIPDAASPNGFAAPSWDDYVIRNFLGTIDKVSYKTVGSVGNRSFVVEWLSVGHVGGEFLSNHSFQIVLRERDGVIEFHYGTWRPDEAVDSATVGLEQAAGTDGDCSDCGAANGSPSVNVIWTPATRPVEDNLVCIGTGGRSGSTIDATGLSSTECGEVDNHDVQFVFYSPGGTFTFDTCSDTALDTTLAIRTFELGSENFACSNNACGPSGAQSKITVDLAANTKYIVRLAGDQGAQGEYSLRVTPHDPPVGDTCAEAVSLGSGAEVESTQSTLRNTGCSPGLCDCGDQYDQWLRWTAPASGNAIVTTCGEGTNFDTTIHVKDSHCFGGTHGLNDDTDSCPFSIASKVSWQATAGRTYLFRVAGAGFQRGDYRLHLRVSELFSDDFEWGSTVAWSKTAP